MHVTLPSSSWPGDGTQHYIVGLRVSIVIKLGCFSDLQIVAS